MTSATKLLKKAILWYLLHRVDFQFISSLLICLKTYIFKRVLSYKCTVCTSIYTHMYQYILWKYIPIYININLLFIQKCFNQNKTMNVSGKGGYCWLLLSKGHLTQLNLVIEPLINIYEINITRGGVQFPANKIRYTSKKGGGKRGNFC